MGVPSASSPNFERIKQRPRYSSFKGSNYGPSPPPNHKFNRLIPSQRISSIKSNKSSSSSSISTLITSISSESTLITTSTLKKQIINKHFNNKFVAKYQRRNYESSSSSKISTISTLKTNSFILPFIIDENDDMKSIKFENDTISSESTLITTKWNRFSSLKINKI